MSWQEKACHAGIGAKHKAEAAGKNEYETMQDILAAALPLIEVTPGMANAGKDQLGRHFPKWHDATKAFEAMISHCAKEKTP
jgi:hypothetical protein